MTILVTMECVFCREVGRFEVSDATENAPVYCPTCKATMALRKAERKDRAPASHP